jgi:uncharacterized hydrophobic protein (TIGR00271 family)
VLGPWPVRERNHDQAASHRRGRASNDSYPSTPNYDFAIDDSDFNGEIDGDVNRDINADVTIGDPPFVEPEDATDDALGMFSSFRSLPPREVAIAATELAAVAVIAWILLRTTTEIGHILARVAGVMVAPYLGMVAWRKLRGPNRRWLEGIGAVVGALIGLAFAIEPERYEVELTRLAGVMMLIVAISLEWRSRSLRASAPVRRAHSRAALLAISGLGFVVLPTTAFSIAVWLIVATLGARTVLSATMHLGLVDLEVDPERPLLLHWLDSKLRTEEDRGVLYDQVYFEGVGAPRKLAGFVLLMVFASIISAMGVLTDSTAVVIGAMLIAPLINPMMGMGLALTMGWPNRLSRSALIVLLGVTIAVGAGWVFAGTVDLVIDVGTNSQIVSRSSPTVGDLIIAVAAGAAGAYALSRREMSSSLPGVAVAIALVPPLSVIGITAHARDWEQMRGTTLLFLTNFVAIVVVGGIVFVLTGIAPIKRLAENQLRVRTSAAAISALAVIIVGALIFNGHQIASDTLASSNARRAVLEWLGEETDFTIESVTIDDETIDVVLLGPGDPPSEDHLARSLDDAVGHDVELQLRWTVQESRSASSD